MSGQMFQCPECRLHYRDEATMRACEAFCSANKACSLDIAKQAVENEAHS